jgi:hypothetical protein
MAGHRALWLLGIIAPVFVGSASGQDDEPPALNPFEPQARVREGDRPARLELSDGRVVMGPTWLTREARLKILEAATQERREIPLSAVVRIDVKVEREWLEKEWRFKENANDEKVYTGRTYPAREYVHTIHLQNGSKVEGRLSALLYVQPRGADEPEKFVLHDRDKGQPGTSLKSLIYVKSIEFGSGATKQAGKPERRR